MKTYILLLTWLFISQTVLAAPAPKLSYTIYPFQIGNGHTLSVKLVFKGMPNGKTKVSIPFNERSPLGNQIVLVKISNSYTHYYSRTDSATYIIEHKPNAELSIHYLVKNALADTLPSAEEINSRMITDKYFYVLGSDLWVIPKTNNHKNYNISLAWLGFKSTTLLNSHGAQASYQNFTTSLDKFQYAMYMGGDLRVHKINIHDKPLFFGVRASWSFKDEEAIEIVRKTVNAQRKFWKDYSIKQYAVGLLPMKMHSAEERSITGRGLYNSFISIGTNSKSLGLEDLAYLYNHELMHYWFGQVLQQNQPENAYKWFHEGFTDYFAHLVMQESGFLNAEKFKTRINSIFAGYYSDSTHQWPNSKLEKDYWSSPEIQQLPYQRGLIFAFYMDESIRLHSGGKSDLREVIKQMLFNGKSPEKRFSTDHFLDLAQRASGKNYRSEFEEFITRGRFISIEEWKKISHRIELASSEIYDIGFSTDRGIALNAVITAVEEGSNVQKAGLKAGDVMAGFSSNKNVSDSTTLTIRRGQEKISMRYLPARKIYVPQLK